METAFLEELLAEERDREHDVAVDGVLPRLSRDAIWFFKHYRLSATAHATLSARFSTFTTYLVWPARVHYLCGLRVHPLLTALFMHLYQDYDPIIGSHLGVDASIPGHEDGHDVDRHRRRSIALHETAHAAAYVYTCVVAGRVPRWITLQRWSGGLCLNRLLLARSMADRFAWLCFLLAGALWELEYPSTLCLLDDRGIPIHWYEGYGVDVYLATYLLQRFEREMAAEYAASPLAQLPRGRVMRLRGIQFWRAQLSETSFPVEDLCWRLLYMLEQVAPEVEACASVLGQRGVCTSGHEAAKALHRRLATL